MEFQRLLPNPGRVTLPEALESEDLASLAHEDRPYTLANFVVSLDGRATFQGRSGQLGDDGDRAMFHALRGQVDAILAGTTTMRTERYGCLIRDAGIRRRRVERGLQLEPLACVVTRSGHVPFEIPLFAQPDARVVVFAPAPPDTSSCAAHVEVVVLDPDELTLTTALHRLRRDHGIRTLLCEGGPTVFGGLIHERLVDELFLTIAPKLVGGGDGPTISSGPELAELQAAGPIWALERRGSLYLRYALAG